MRNWGTAVTAFYVLVIAALSPGFALFVTMVGDSPDWRRQFRDGLASTYAEWGFWAWILALAGGPLILLCLRIDLSHLRLRPRRRLAVSVAAAGFALALLLLAAVVNIALAALPRDFDYPEGTGWILLAVWLGAWLLWALLLWRLADRVFDPAGGVFRWLLAGSVLELLIAVPAHVVVRQREDCTAPAVSGFGVATGLAILLMSLGPGVLFLYRARIRRIPRRSRSGRGGADGR
jgi:hypothetical protein